MKCIACGNEVSGSSCLYCQFPVYEIVGDNVDESVAQINALAKTHRENYLNNLQLGVLTYKWKAENGKIVEDSQIPEYFADGQILKNGEVWFSGKFARIPNEDTLKVKMAIKTNTRIRTLSVDIPNLMEPELQEIGFRLEDMLHVRMLLKNDSHCSESEPLSVAIG